LNAKSESDKTRAEEITKQIIELKQQIATQQKECVALLRANGLAENNRK